MESQQQNRAFKKYLFRLFQLWLIWSVIYFPFFCMLHAEDIQYFTVAVFVSWVREIIFVGSFYHLWFLGALFVGTVIVYIFYRVGMSPITGVICSAVLYLIGLLGHSYDFLLSNLPTLNQVKNVYLEIFFTTRNGVFFAPLFLSLGWLTTKISHLPRKSFTWIGMGVFLLTLSGETVLANQHSQDHLEMFVMLPVVGMFLFLIILQIHLPDSPVWIRLRAYSTLIFLIHPLVILFYRFLGNFWDIGSLYIVRYCFVAVISTVIAAAVVWLQKRRGISWLRVFY